MRVARKPGRAHDERRTIEVGGEAEIVARLGVGGSQTLVVLPLPARPVVDVEHTGEAVTEAHASGGEPVAVHSRVQSKDLAGVTLGRKQPRKSLASRLALRIRVLRHSGRRGK